MGVTIYVAWLGLAGVLFGITFLIYGVRIIRMLNTLSKTVVSPKKNSKIVKVLYIYIIWIIMGKNSLSIKK